MQLQSKVKKIRELGAEVVAVSADEGQTADATRKALRLGFPVLSDPEKKVIRLYGILHPDEGIARPTIFIIDRKGFVRFRYIGKDAADRPKTELIVNLLQWL